jgi:hypothetical protein
VPTVFWIFGQVEGEGITDELEIMFNAYNGLATFIAGTRFSNENVYGHTPTSRILIWSFYFI